MVSAPEDVLLVERRLDLQILYALSPDEADAAIFAALEEWQVLHALCVRERDRLSWEEAVERARAARRPSALLPDTLHVVEERDALLREAALLSVLEDLCCFSIIDYVDQHGDVVQPIGVVVLCPGQDFAAYRFDLRWLSTVLLPRSPRWRRVDSYSYNLSHWPPRTVPHLEQEMVGEQEFEPARHRVFRYRPLRVQIADPALVLQSLEEALKMGKLTTELNPATASRVNENATCDLLRKFSDQYNDGDLETAMHLLAQQYCEDAYDTKIILYERLISLMRNGSIEKHRVDRIMEDARMVSRWSEAV